MLSELQSAVDFANQIRFSGDTLLATDFQHAGRSSTLKNLFFSNELSISKEVTPALYGSLESVLDRLGVAKDAVEAFVYASPEINAECYSGDRSECVIRFTSGLVDILNESEFEFVVGHELGHFLLSHSIARMENNNESIEFYMQQRAQEISADRLGLIACDSLDVAIKALIKTVSGLSEEHLRFDVGSFLSQLRKTTGVSGQGHQSTHPSILVRCRALLWFSINDSFIKKSRVYLANEVLDLDSKIQNDLAKYVDGSARNKIEDAKNNLSMWMAAYEITQDDKFTKKEQEMFSEMFGKETLDKLISFLNDLSGSEIKGTVFSKVEDAKRELELLVPSSFEKELESLNRWSS
ncbi:MAG: M48 family metallopeptidase [Thiotrichaceae bacterium]|nr:M48 family metallopeptidase [Thiotrichaceae bacterium]